MKQVLNRILTKLTSRKLWVAIIGVVVGLAAAFGIEENEYAQITGLVITAINTVAYILGEAKIDAAMKGEVVVVPEIGAAEHPIGFSAAGAEEGSEEEKETAAG